MSNLTQVEVRSNNNTGLKFVKLYIDGTLLSKQTSAPFIWTAEEFAEIGALSLGTHTFKTVAKSSDNHRSAQNFSVEVTGSTGSDPRIPQYDYKKVHGVWDRSGTEDEYGVFRGRNAGIAWKATELEKGQFDWKVLESEVREAHERDQYLYWKVNVGPVSPDWIYEESVPKVLTDSNRFDHYPY